MEQKDSYKVRITEPTIFAPANGERRHLQARDELTMPAEDAFNVVQSGKGVLIDGQLPNDLKQAPRK